MPGDILKIGVMAPGSRIDTTIADQVKAFARELYGERCPDIFFHPQCFLSSGHFAGDDEARLAAFLDIANDDGIDAVWFARGGYGSCRIAEAAIEGLNDSARRKLYMGYSDTGILLAGLFREAFPALAHGPMPGDILRTNGEAAIERALRYLVKRAPDTLEASVSPDRKAAAFNVTILSQMLGTPLEPDLSGHVIMLEDVSEYMYRIDRALFHITSNPGIRRAAGLMLGRWSDIPENDPDFVRTDEEVIRYWSERSGIPYLGRADIGHDADNKVVPFGMPAVG